jgi:hypothetical protein
LKAEGETTHEYIGIKIGMWSDAGSEGESPIDEVDAPPDLGGKAVSIMVRLVTLVEIGRARVLPPNFHLFHLCRCAIVSGETLIVHGGSHRC